MTPNQIAEWCGVVMLASATVVFVAACVGIIAFLAFKAWREI